MSCSIHILKLIIFVSFSCSIIVVIDVLRIILPTSVPVDYLIFNTCTPHASPTAFVYEPLLLKAWNISMITTYGTDNTNQGCTTIGPDYKCYRICIG